ncbi:MAG TPA: sigma-70 family RNA polymerase sigma factor [Pseudoxanthomonas sp.]|nr:sigma-70 family RNA polymerase sigma factor [Pseudoxanthomonas sp.]
MRRDTERIFDEYLAAAARTGDRAAWERLVARWHPRLLRHARRLTGHPEQAQDMVQEAWLEILRGLRRLDDVAAFPAWAFRIVTRRCQRAFQHADKERRGIAELTREAEDSAPEAASGESAAELANVMAAMHELPAAQHVVLALFYLDNLSVAEISIALDVPPGTVKTRLMHARRKIRARLEGETDEQDG